MQSRRVIGVGAIVLFVSSGLLGVRPAVASALDLLEPPVRPAPKNSREAEGPKLSCVYLTAGADGLVAELYSDVRGKIMTVEMTPVVSGAKKGNGVQIRFQEVVITDSRFVGTGNGFYLRVDRFLTSQGIPYFTGELRWERLVRGLPHMLSCVVGAWATERS